MCLYLVVGDGFDKLDGLGRGHVVVDEDPRLFHQNLFLHNEFMMRKTDIVAFLIVPSKVGVLGTDCSDGQSGNAEQVEALDYYHDNAFSASNGEVFEVACICTQVFTNQSCSSTEKKVITDVVGKFGCIFRESMVIKKLGFFMTKLSASDSQVSAKFPKEEA